MSLYSVEPSDVLDFWFGQLEGDAFFPEDKASMWFRGGPEVDEEISRRFGAAVQSALAGQLDNWKVEPRSCLALILLLDQFTRNIYRGMARAYSGDAQALELCLWGMERGYDLELWPVEAWFFYLPLEHSEDFALQKKSVQCYEALVERSAPAIELPIRNALDYAEQHRDLIERFGRFPHRNDALGRLNTEEEEKYLLQPNAGF
ncbi:MAG: DUF924 domain-containing protein [Candidatus Omnitrophica bacterium]|nr:DUF924 domain-containing protein [Candidatus Omnitrophota bacterium]